MLGGGFSWSVPTAVSFSIVLMSKIGKRTSMVCDAKHFESITIS